MCDTVVVVKPEGVLFAKNSDRDPNEAQVLEWHPRAEHSAGATVRCTWIEVPQAPATHAVLISRPFWMWGAEMGTNEHGVSIGNEAVFTSEPYAATGLTGMDLLRLALERAGTAAQAVEVLSELLERHGQGGGAGHEHRSFTYHNSYLIADRREAFVLETAGTRWAVEHVTGGVRTISNGLTISGFAERYSDRLRTAVSRCRTRQSLTSAGAQDADPGRLMSLMRSHGADGGPSPEPSYNRFTGALGAPCVHAGGRLTTAQTTGSWVSELSGDRVQHWVTGTSAPCTSLYKPAQVQEPLDLGPAPSDHFDPHTLWWRHERLHRMAMRDPGAAQTFMAERDEVQRQWLGQPPASAAAFAQAEALLERWTRELGVVDDVRPRWVRRFWAQRDHRSGMRYGARDAPVAVSA